MFFDDMAVLFDDPDHSEDEERYLILGFSSSANLLMVCHCVRNSGSTIRLISARKATKNEELQYAELNRG